MSQSIIILRRELSDGSCSIQEINPDAYPDDSSFKEALHEFISKGYSEVGEDKMLKLTWQELEDIVNQRGDERFVEIFDDIPMYHKDHVRKKGETHRDYCEDDGREFRWFIFKDSETDIEYCLNYTFNADWPHDLRVVDKMIKVVETVEESDIYMPPYVTEEKEPELTEAEKNDKALWNQYLEVENECKVFEPKDKINVPKNEIDDLIRFFNTKQFSMFDLRAKMLPFCIQYRLEQKSFLRWIQGKNK